MQPTLTKLQGIFKTKNPSVFGPKDFYISFCGTIKVLV